MKTEHLESVAGLKKRALQKIVEIFEIENGNITIKVQKGRFVRVVFDVGINENEEPLLERIKLS